MKGIRTEQEDFWAGEIGDKYIEKNSKTLRSISISNSIAMFSKILSGTKSVESVIEFGSNIGLNLRAIKMLLPNAKLSAIEINNKAISELEKIEGLKVYNMSIPDFVPDFKRDFVFTKGVLIHINPNILQDVYGLLYETTNRYICIAEYYNPTLLEVIYRGQRNKLFKRDFAGEMLNKFNDLQLVDYGFVYHRDNNFPEDDITWFLMEKV